MYDFLIVTDSVSDIPDSLLEERAIHQMYLSCILNGEVFGKEKRLDIQNFYKGLREGTLPTTSQINPDEAKKEFLAYSKENKNILYIAASSGLSGTYQSGVIAANEIMEEHPEIKIKVVDSLCASMGQGILVLKAANKRDEDCTLEETAAYIESIKMNVSHLVAVDDLFHLCRGGRVSRSSAVIGSMIKLKPLLIVNNEGKLVNEAKVRGRKKSLLALVDMMEERLGSFKDPAQNVEVSVCHGDCLEEAQMVADEIKKRFGFENIILNYFGAIVGSHTGPNTLAVFFMADKR